MEGNRILRGFFLLIFRTIFALRCKRPAEILHTKWSTISIFRLWRRSPGLEIFSHFHYENTSKLVNDKFKRETADLASANVPRPADAPRRVVSNILRAQKRNRRCDMRIIRVNPRAYARLWMRHLESWNPLNLAVLSYPGTRYKMGDESQRSDQLCCGTAENCHCRGEGGGSLELYIGNLE